MAVSKGSKILNFECKSAWYNATIVFHCLCICYSFTTYCLQQASSKCLQIFKNSSKSWIFIKNIFKPFEKRLRKIVISGELDLCEKTLLILNFISEIKMELLLPISKRTLLTFTVTNG